MSDPPTVIFLDIKPTKLNTRISPSLASMLYFPSKSVATPSAVPSITTAAPSRGIPDPSFTTPVIVFCAHPVNATSTLNNNTSFFFISYI